MLKRLATAVLIAIVLPGCFAEQDKRDVRVVAARIHEQLRAEDFSSIYEESTSRFKSVGSKSEFVNSMREFQQQYGRFLSASEVAYETGFDTKAGTIHVLHFLGVLEKSKVRQRIVFVRTDSGTIKLWKLEMKPIIGASANHASKETILAQTRVGPA